MRPATLAPVKVLGERKPHGSRLRYMAGCRCLPCRAANSNYETMRYKRRRMGLWNGLVSARRARRHILKLSRAGVGRRTVGLIARIADSVLFKIRSGQRKQIRALTEKAILSVPTSAVRGSTLVSANGTWQKIEWLLEEGFTRRELARRMGSSAKSPALQLRRDRITATNAKKIEAIWRSVN
jgi:hypothetical protein